MMKFSQNAHGIYIFSVFFNKVTKFYIKCLRFSPVLKTLFQRSNSIKVCWLVQVPNIEPDIPKNLTAQRNTRFGSVPKAP